MKAIAPATSSSYRWRAGASRTGFVMIPPSLAARRRPTGGLGDGLSLRDLADPRVALANEPARPQCRGLEVRIVGGQELPLRGFPAEHPDRPHPRKFPAQALVMLRRRRQPYAVVSRQIALVAQYQHDL